MSGTWNAFLLDHYNLAAGPYSALIAPPLAPLAEKLVEYAGIARAEKVIDLGCGTGSAARHATRESGFVVGVDFSHEMLARAQVENGRFVRADIERLPLRNSVFECALAEFAFNSSSYVASFSEAFRVLVSGGRLVFQEWGRVDDLSELVSDTLFEYQVAAPPDELARFRELAAQSTPWDELESADDVVECLRHAGFAEISFESSEEMIRFDTIDHFIRHKLAWPIRSAETQAMPQETRRLFFNDLRENLAARVEADLSLVWRPEVLRFKAYRFG